MTIAGLDMDDSFSVPSLASIDEPSAAQLHAREQTRQLLKESRVVSMAQSMRSWELMLSYGEYATALEIQQLRPPPRWQQMRVKEGFVYMHTKIEQLAKFHGCLDWDAMLVPGNGIAFRNGSEYVVDWEWDDMLNFVIDHKGRRGERPWREAALDFITTLDPMIVLYFSPLEGEGNYDLGKANVKTLPYRIQLDFQGKEGLAQKQAFKRKLNAALYKLPRFIQTIDESNPAKDRYTLYLVPWWGTKERLLKRFVEQSAQAAGLTTSHLKLRLVGDTLTDLRAGLYGGGHAQVKFLLPENSRLTPYVWEWLRGTPPEWAHAFAGEPLVRLMRHLIPTSTKGHYRFFVTTRRKYVANTLVFGAEALPDKVGAEATLEFLQQELD